MTITTVEKTRDKNMVRIFIDDRYAFTIPQEDYIRNHLYEAEDISEEKIEFIRKNVLIRGAKERGLRYLTLKDRSESEVVKKILDAGYDEDIAIEACVVLKGLGYLNDRRYAMRYLDQRVSAKAISKKALLYELQQKGIHQEILEEVFAEFEMDDEDVALRAARKKFGKYDINDKKIEQKLINFLFHRGFSFETSKRVLNIMKAEY